MVTVLGTELLTIRSRSTALLRVVAPCKIVLVIPNPVSVSDFVIVMPHSVQRLELRTMVSPSFTKFVVTAFVNVGKVL